MGSDVVVVDPPRKGLDPSLVEALYNISLMEQKSESASERLDQFSSNLSCGLYFWDVIWFLWEAINSLLKYKISPSTKVKDEKRPWILRAREASVQLRSNTTPDDSKSLPQTLIYISCGWESFKEVLTQIKWLLQNKKIHLLWLFTYLTFGAGLDYFKFEEVDYFL